MIAAVLMLAASVIGWLAGVSYGQRRARETLIHAAHSGGCVRLTYAGDDATWTRRFRVVEIDGRVR